MEKLHAVLADTDHDPAHLAGTAANGAVVAWFKKPCGEPAPHLPLHYQASGPAYADLHSTLAEAGVTLLPPEEAVRHIHAA